MSNHIKQILVIDGSFFCYFYHYSEPILVGDVPIQAFLRAISSIRYFLTTGYDVEIVWDGHAQWRYDLLPEYKSSRRKNEELAETRKFLKKVIMPKLMLFLKYIPVTQWYSPHDEADDLVTYRVAKAKKTDELANFKLLCSDTDWLQLVASNCSWWNFRSKKLVTIADFGKNDFYDSPLQSAEAKILSGDTSDDIPGISGIAEKRALTVLRKYGGLDGLIAAIQSGQFKENKNFQGLLAPEAISTIARNKELILLKDREFPELRKFEGTFNEHEVAKLLAEVGAEEQTLLWKAANTKVIKQRDFLKSKQTERGLFD